MNDNLFRRVNWLWKHRHTHNGDDLQEQITIIRTQVEGQADAVVVGGSGAYIHLAASDQTIAVGGEDVEWAGINPLGLFEFQPVFPTTTIQVLKSGYYNLAVPVLEWTSWTLGGSVSIWRNDIKVWPPPDDAGWSIDVRSVWRADAAHAVWFDAGDTFRLFIDHGSGSSQVLAHAALSAYLVDRAGTPEWELVFSADNYGVTWDGTNWWTTDHSDNVNPALFKRNASGVVVASYPGYDDSVLNQDRNRGIVFAASFLWGVGNEEVVSKVDPADGTVDSTFTVLPDPGSQTGIGYDGTNLYTVEQSVPHIQEFSLAGVLQNTFSHPSGRTLTDIAWGGTGWWATTTTSEVVKLDASFIVQESLAGPADSNRGCHFLNGFLYVMTPSGLHRKAV